MYSVSFNRKEVCKLFKEDLQVLRQIAVFWGLHWDDARNELTSRLSDKTIRIIGLNRKELNRLTRALDHTQASLTTHPCHADLNLSIFKETDPNITFKVESNNKVYEFEPPDKPFNRVSDMIYKQFEPHNLIGEAKIYLNPVNCPEITEWLTYLILQLDLQESSSVLRSVPLKTYEKLLRNVLVPINPFLSSYHLKLYWPELPSSKNMIGHGSEEPFNPFKSKNNDTSQINPFKQKKNATPSTINPFRHKGK